MTSSGESKPLLRVRDLAVSFESGGGVRVPAVRGVRMSIHPGQVLAVVGESGCGKSVTAMSTLQLIPRPPGRFDGGQVLFDSSRSNETRSQRDAVDLLKLPESQMRSIRGNEIAMIFQEPMSSLNPVYTVGDQIVEAICLHQNSSRAEAYEIAAESMVSVGISDPRRRVHQYPHEFSGGMRQRMMIAMALACRPRLLLADEPTTALDVTVQAQILELLRALRVERQMAIMLITHALGVVAENADTVCVMYGGRVVEYAPVFELFDNPMHPYTRGLLASIPRLGDRRARLTTIRQIIDDPGEFTRLPGLRPWWPSHAAPPETEPGPDREYTLAQLGLKHWVGLWRTPAAAALPDPEPDIAFISPR